MKIIVLDFGCNSVDVITVAPEVVNKYGDEENYLIEHCGYNLDNIQWMAGDDIQLNLDMTHDDFEGCDESLSD